MAAAFTRLRVEARISGESSRALDTVAMETLAALATSIIVIRCLGILARMAHYARVIRAITMNAMAELSAAWSDQAQKALGAALPLALEAFAHNSTVREIVKIHGPETTLWVQSADASALGWILNASYAAPEGDAVHFKVNLKT